MKKSISLILLSAFLFACGGNLEKDSHASSEQGTIVDGKLHHVDWSKNATIYEANIRQMTPEGTFKALESDLVDIKKLGIKIIWLMPIQPIGELNRKGGLGSYYSVKDYKAINPEYGNLEDLQSLVRRAHELDMKVILDWVANHTAWDHPWTISHPEWYTKDSLGNFMPPVPDWSDVIDLNYDNLDMRRAMIDDMRYWIEEADVDGFRCDVAYFVPTEFWNDLRSSLDSLKPVFMLAEADQTDHHYEAFDMSYGWELFHIMNHVASGDSSLQSIDSYMQRELKRYSKNDYRMYFLTNHDENSWNGTIEKRYGAAEKAYAVLAFTINGMPLIYSGQEYGNNKAMAFFEKDNPNYAEPEIFDFYSQLLHLNVENKALWNGEFGGDYSRIASTDDENIFALKRQKGDNVVISIVNLSDKETSFDLSIEEEYTLNDLFSEEEMLLTSNTTITLAPYGYKVMFK